MLGGERFTVASGSTAPVAVPLDPTARALLAAAPRHVLRVRVVVRVAGQRASSRAVTLRLTGPLPLAPLAFVGPAIVAVRSSTARVVLAGRGVELSGTVHLVVGRTVAGWARYVLGARARAAVVVRLDPAGRDALEHAPRVVASEVVTAAGYRPTTRAVVLVG